jgi:hypothetical protein
VNYLSGNYLQSLLDRRSGLWFFAHNTTGDARGVGQLEFVDDVGRAVWAFAEEERYTPIVRLELVRTLCRGLMRARIPGTRDRHFFSLEGRHGLNVHFPSAANVQFRWLQDEQIPYADLHFRGRTAAGPWITGQDCSWQDQTLRDTPEEICRRRIYRHAGTNFLTLTSRSWSSILDQAPIIDMAADHLQELVVSVSLPPAESTWLVAPQGRIWHPKPGAVTVWPAPDFPYAIFLGQTLGKDNDRWDSRRHWDTHATARLFVWQELPAQLSWMVDETRHQYQRMEIAYQAQLGRLQAKLYLTPFLAVDPGDIGYLHAMAQRVARDGRYGVNGFFPVRTANDYAGVMVGLAAGAYLLQKYGDAAAPEVLAAAEAAFGSFVDAEHRGVQAEYLNNLVAAALYLKRAGSGKFDLAHWAKVWARREMKRRPAGSDVIPWPSTTMRMMMAIEFAKEITGNAAFDAPYAAARKAFSLGNRPATFRFGNQEFSYDYCSPAAFLFAIFGHEDAAAAQAFIDHGPDHFCDFGWAIERAWACDDLAGWYVGYSAKGLGLASDPKARKHVLSLRDFPEYDAGERLRITHELSAPNPYYPLPLKSRQESKSH